VHLIKLCSGDLQDFTHCEYAIVNEKQEAPEKVTLDYSFEISN